MDAMIRESMERLIAETGEDPAALWNAIEEAAFPLVWHSEAQGGFDLPMEDGFGLMRLLAQHACSAPLAETLVAGWLAIAAGLETLTGQLSAVYGGKLSNGRPTGRFKRLAFGSAGHLVCLTEDGRVAVAVIDNAKSVHGIGLDPLYDIEFDGVEIVASASAPDWLDKDAFKALAVIARSAQICGALDAVLDLTISHVQEREQFGRPLSRFQAIQVHLATMAGEVAAASAATEAAISGARRDGPPDFTAAAVAKARASEAAGIVAALSHQCHGAIGYAQEYRLGRLTRRLWQWREDYGNEHDWNAELGRRFVADGRTVVEKVFN
jgi:acyl-CoA dehydrogenase